MNNTAVDESEINAEEKSAEDLAVVVRACEYRNGHIDDALLPLLR